MRVCPCTYSNDKWEIELPNGAYFVVLGYSDVSYSAVTRGCSLEGHSASIGTVPAGQPQTKPLKVVIVDGKLTLAGSFDAV